MPTKFMKLGFDKQVLRRLTNDSDGYVLEVGLNYYRGTPVSAVERLELSVDGERVDDDRILVEVNGKLLRLPQLPLAFTEYWGVKTPIRLHVAGEPLAAGKHDVDLVCEARVVYMQFAPGVYGMLDASASGTLTVDDAEETGTDAGTTSPAAGAALAAGGRPAGKPAATPPASTAINGIEQAVSCYSYTQEFIENDDWSIDTIFERVAAKGVSKVELVGGQTFQQYPTPRADEIDAVLAAGEKHGVEVFSYGGYVDLGRITGHEMSREDILSDIRLDIMTARDLGARFMRATGFGPELAPAVNEVAERYGVQIGFEIHAPHTPGDPTTLGFMETIEKNQLGSFGLVPDFGMFIERPTEIAINRYVGLGARRETLEWIIANRHNGMTEEEMQEHVATSMGGGEGEKVAISEWFGYLSFAPAELDSFAAMVPYVKYVHGKFYHLELDEDGKVFEPTIPYEQALSILAQGGFQGVFISEYEGHAFYLNDADEQIDRHLELGRSILKGL